MKHLYLLFICLFALSGKATPVRLTNPTQADNLFGKMDMLKVPAGRVSLNNLLQHPDTYTFAPAQSKDIEPYNRAYGYWLRFALTNETPGSYFLEFIYGGTEKIVVYELADNRVMATHELGTLHAETTYPFLKSNQVAPVSLKQGQTHTFYVYLEGVYTPTWPIYCRSTINLLQYMHLNDLFYGLYYGFILMITVYSLLLYIQLHETDTLRYAVWVMLMGGTLALFRGHTNEFLWSSNPTMVRYATVLAGVTGLMHILFTLAFLRLRQKAPLFYKIGIGVFALYALGILINVLSVTLQQQAGQQIDIVPTVSLFEGLFSVLAGVTMYRRGFKPALFYVIGNLLFFASIYFFLQYAAGNLPHSFWSYNIIHVGSSLEIIFFTLALTYKVNLLKQQQEKAVHEQLRLAETNKRLVEQQNTLLEAKVAQRTDELNQQKEDLQTTLSQLQATQEQLIQKEKMASLGELMAGIAHEIQNPLNFVNNFSEVSAELVDDLNDELDRGDVDEVKILAVDLRENLQKISFHGGRASNIVKSMLAHSRTGTDAPQPTDLNALADEFLRLAYQGMRAKDKTDPTNRFNCHLVTQFDPAVGSVSVVPPAIGRVLLNLYNNAFYAMEQHRSHQPANGEPTLWVSTHRLADAVEIRVRDNGTGIPPHLLNKIFQPFFTTKPTGEGTGLGLSLSYDIITKEHRGTMRVESREGEGTTFIVALPAS